MLLPEETKTKYGYHPDELSHSSAKLVVVRCDECSVLTEKPWYAVQRAKHHGCCREHAMKATSRHTDFAAREAKTRARCLQQHGVLHPGMREDVVARRKLNGLSPEGTYQHPPVYQLMADETQAAYGYAPSQLAPGSKREVLLRCCVCGLVHRRALNKVYRTGTGSTCSRACTTQLTRQVWETKYGANHPWKVAVIQTQKKEQFERRHGVRNPSQLPETERKRKETSRRVRGVDHPMKDPAVQMKRKATLLRRFGTIHPMQNEALKAKALGTRLQTYGGLSMYHAARKAGNTKEQQVRDFLNSLGLDFQEAVIPTSLSLDGYSAEHKAAFEFHGLFWHCEDSKSPRRHDYHRSKLLKCREHGIRLFSIFEDEWTFRRPQVEGFLRAALGKNTDKLQARKTSVKLVDDKTAQAFYAEFHIQGRTTKGSHSAGLYDGDRLVGVMTFGRHHRGGKDVVLTRLCFRTNVSIVGGSAKLFSFLIKETKAEKVISWSDNRWSEGGVYKALGFSFGEELPPDYSYVNLNRATVRLSKQSQKKSTTGCPPNLTELQWAKQRGLSRIWDCGKIRWEWTKP